MCGIITTGRYRKMERFVMKIRTMFTMVISVSLSRLLVLYMISKVDEYSLNVLLRGTRLKALFKIKVHP